MLLTLTFRALYTHTHTLGTQIQYTNSNMNKIHSRGTHVARAHEQCRKRAHPIPSWKKANTAIATTTPKAAATIFGFANRRDERKRKIRRGREMRRKRTTSWSVVYLCKVLQQNQFDSGIHFEDICIHLLLSRLSMLIVYTFYPSSSASKEPPPASQSASQAAKRRQWEPAMLTAVYMYICMRARSAVQTHTRSEYVHRNDTAINASAHSRVDWWPM